MREIVDFLTSVKIAELATDPKVLFLVLVVAVVAVLLRWKLVLLLLFAFGGILAVLHYTNPALGGGGVDTQMGLFVGGIMAVAVILIYFLFIKGD
jgi:hypothetical protein